MATHVVVGRSDNRADEVIVRLAADGGDTLWTVPRVARAGDRVLFYLLNPEGSFVATGFLKTSADPGSSSEGDGAYVAEVAQVQMLPRAVPRLEVVGKVPSWGWPRQPHTATTVPVDQVAQLMGVLT
jgi:hypothetical protein